MKLVNLNGPQDVMALLVRRKWWILLPFIALSAAAVLITVILPQMYVSQSLVIIQPRDVPDDFVKNLIAGSAEERLSVITAFILSDKNLETILDNIDLPEFHGLNKQEKLFKLRKQLDLQFDRGEHLKKAQLPVSAFRITCQNREPLMAQKIVKQLTERFMSEEDKNREENVFQTAHFLENRVDELKTGLTESDNKLKELKSRRRGELPDQLESNLRRLENLYNENEGFRRDRTNYVLAQSQLEKQLSETPKLIAKPPAPAPQVIPPDPDVEDYRTIQKTVKGLTTMGRTDEHPDMIQAKLALKRKEASMTPEQKVLAKREDIPSASALTPTTDADAMQNNPVYMNMESNLEFLRKQIEYIDERTKQNDAAIKDLDLHVSNVPQGEQELTDVLRENNKLNREYEEMNSKLAAARLSKEAESEAKGKSFAIVDPASLPINPTKPSKLPIVSAGLILSLLIALGIGFVVDIANQKTWTQSDVASLLGVKVLVEVPRVVTRAGAARTRKKKVGFIASVGVASVAYAVCLFVAYNHSGFVLRSLDPLIQKLY